MRTSWFSNPRRGQRGFTLLEVLVAFAILALSLGVMFRIFSGTLNNSTRTEAYARAVALAESRLSAVGFDLPLETGEYSGEEADLHWQVRISEYAGGDPPLPESRFVPYQVLVSVTWGSGERTPELSLSSLRLLPAAAVR